MWETRFTAWQTTCISLETKKKRHSRKTGDETSCEKRETRRVFWKTGHLKKCMAFREKPGGWHRESQAISIKYNKKNCFFPQTVEWLPLTHKNTILPQVAEKEEKPPEQERKASMGPPSKARGQLKKILSQVSITAHLHVLRPQPTPDASLPPPPPLSLTPYQLVSGTNPSIAAAAAASGGGLASDEINLKLPLHETTFTTIKPLLEFFMTCYAVEMVRRENAWPCADISCFIAYTFIFFPSDQDILYSCSVNTVSSRQAMRMKKNSNRSKFSELTSWELHDEQWGELLMESLLVKGINNFRHHLHELNSLFAGHQSNQHSCRWNGSLYDGLQEIQKSFLQTRTNENFPRLRCFNRGQSDVCTCAFSGKLQRRRRSCNDKYLLLNLEKKVTF